MPLTCNIDAKGKFARLICGMLVGLIGILLVIFWAWGSAGAIPWLISLGVLAAGAFMIFEARAGWCVMRALGFRTPM
jgi:hypothetical protein